MVLKCAVVSSDTTVCKTNCCGLDQEGPLKRAEIRELFSSDACVSKTWIIATIYVLLYSYLWMGVLWSVWHCLLYPALHPLETGYLPTAWVRLRCVTFGRQAFHLKTGFNIIWQFWPWLATVVDFCWGEKINHMETNQHALVSSQMPLVMESN